MDLTYGVPLYNIPYLVIIYENPRCLLTSGGRHALSQVYEQTSTLFHLKM
jgi:hypothetical protein